VTDALTVGTQVKAVVYLKNVGHADATGISFRVKRT
jgi:hypothetical protein